LRAARCEDRKFETGLNLQREMVPRTPICPKEKQMSAVLAGSRPLPLDLCETRIPRTLCAAGRRAGDRAPRRVVAPVHKRCLDWREFAVGPGRVLYVGDG